MFDVPRSTAPRRFERGVALVITLIMLSVTLVMAVAFLALARRERGSVTTATEITTARLAADSALAAAQSQIAANILANNATAYNFGLQVSTNYFNSYGFVSGISNPTNVSYFDANGNLLAGDDLIQNIANLWFLPRAPVFIITNQATGSNDFRFYLDLNENGRFEPNGYQPVLSPDPNNPYYDTNGNVVKSFNPPNILSNNVVGDPEWIGVLERPDQPHSANNHFIARYAFFAQPIGNSLDLNYIHNQAKTFELNQANDGYFRNEGVGSWELNLAAFLTDLNTNQWDPPTIENPANNSYDYLRWTNNNRNTGVGFEDALALLSWRYNNNYNSLAVPPVYFQDGLFNACIDGYTFGNLMTNTILPTVNVTHNQPWAGSDSTNHFFALPSAIFDPSKNLGNFPSHLRNAGTNVSTYDRYTFYRMLAQLGTDSSPDDGKLNLNYRNVTNGAVVVGMETNLYPWTALEFFTNAADRMLRMYTTNWFQSSPSNYLWTYYAITNNYFYIYTDASGHSVTNIDDPSGKGLVNTFGVPNVFGLTSDGIPTFGITNIPVWVSNRFVYSPAVNRQLQLAANLYDATTTNIYPSVFRPIFKNDGVNVFISGYQQIVSVPYPPDYGESAFSGLSLSQPVDVTAILNLSAGTYYCNVYGVPWIIGAKKNLPAFNQSSMVNSAQVTRKLQIARKILGGSIWTNQMYSISINNNCGASFWNSYSNNYPTNYSGPLKLSAYVSDTVRIVLTNSDTVPVTRNITYTTNYTFTPTIWPGSKWGAAGSGDPASGSFISLNWTNNFLPELIYKIGKGFAATNDTDPWDIDTHKISPLPQFGLVATNWLQAIIVDNSNVIDYVQLRGPIDSINVSNVIKDPDWPDATKTGLLQWSMNQNSDGVPYGVINQIVVSKTGSQNLPAGGKWVKPVNFPSSVPDTALYNVAEASFFGGMFDPDSKYTVDGITYTNYELAVQAPYTPSRTIYGAYLYQVNDPLVHYTVDDLDAGSGAVWANTSAANGVWSQSDDPLITPIPVPPTTAIIKGRYQPWSKAAPTALQSPIFYNFLNYYNLIYKDPLVWSSDYWDFPTNRYPSVGWIGRVHRGTPWQTVYLKASDVLNGNNNIGINTWSAWTGDKNTFDAVNSAPLQDRLLFDLFTTRFNDNAVRGTLSVNQTGLAAWSALFSGLVALSNNVPIVTLTGPVSLTTTNMIINPAGVDLVNSPLWKIVNGTNGINATRTNMNFTNVGGILNVRALTEQSPFINTSSGTMGRSAYSEPDYGISDEVYEWLPQQMMGLLRCSTEPHYVLYCYGQTLKPAPNGVVTSGSFFGLCTNYQVTAESAVRAVIRVDKQITPTGTNYSTVVESYNVLPSN